MTARRGRSLPAPALGLTHVFPTADRLVDLRADGLGMPTARVDSIAALARAVVDGSLDLHPAAGPDGLRAGLLELPGIGPWTAEVVCLRAARDPDAFPASDLGIRQAVGRLVGLDGPAPVARVLGVAEEWRPHRALAAQHLWADLRPTPDKEPT